MTSQRQVGHEVEVSLRRSRARRAEAFQRRRRELFVEGIKLGIALLVIALFAVWLLIKVTAT